MALKDELYDNLPHRSHISKVDVALQNMDSDDADGIRRALADPTVPHTRIASVLSRRGHHMSEKSVSGWRRKHHPETF